MFATFAISAQAKTENVNVVNDSSNPVPVEGSVDVPDQVQVTGDVEISNTELNPVPFLNMNGVMQPFQKKLSF